jgi:hypothetical protein
MPLPLACQLYSSTLRVRMCPTLDAYPTVSVLNAIFQLVERTNTHCSRQRRDCEDFNFERIYYVTFDVTNQCYHSIFESR